MSRRRGRIRRTWDALPYAWQVAVDWLAAVTGLAAGYAAMSVLGPYLWPPP